MSWHALTSAVIVVLATFSAAQQPAPEPSVPTEELRVMAAAMDTFRDKRLASHPIVADRTSTFQCSSGCNGLTMGGCNGLRAKDETPAQRLAIVKRDLPGIESTTLSDFKAKNGRCSRITSKIPAESQYFLFGANHAEKLPSGWEHSDFFYFSRVGFNASQTQALVHISFMSGTNAADSGGRYFLFVRKDGKWVPRAASGVWQLISP